MLSVLKEHLPGSCYVIYKNWEKVAHIFLQAGHFTRSKVSTTTAEVIFPSPSINRLQKKYIKNLAKPSDFMSQEN